MRPEDLIIRPRLGDGGPWQESQEGQDGRRSPQTEALTDRNKIMKCPTKKPRHMLHRDGKVKDSRQLQLGRSRSSMVVRGVLGSSLGWDPLLSCRHTSSQRFSAAVQLLPPVDVAAAVQFAAGGAPLQLQCSPKPCTRLELFSLPMSARHQCVVHRASTEGRHLMLLNPSAILPRISSTRFTAPPARNFYLGTVVGRND